MTKIIGLANTCKECPNRHYYSGGTYECLKVTGSRLNGDSSIPEWCTLPNYAVASSPAADESAKPVYEVTEDDAAWHDTDWMTYDSAPTNRRRIVYTHPAGTASKEAKPSNNVALADLLIREICETDPADPNADDTVCIGLDDLRLIIETCAIEAENAPVASKEAVTLSDDWIELYALRHIAPHAGRFKAAFGVDVQYQQTEQFRRVKSYTEDVVRAALTQRDASKGESTS